MEQLRPLASEASAHHEWVDGQGYHRQLSGEQIPLGGRVLAVADTYATLSKRRGDPADPEDVLQEMRPLVGTRLDPMCFEAFSASLSGAPLPRPSSRQRPGNLTVVDVAAGMRYPLAADHELVIDAPAEGVCHAAVPSRDSHAAGHSLQQARFLLAGDLPHSPDGDDEAQRFVKGGEIMYHLGGRALRCGV